MSDRKRRMLVVGVLGIVWFAVSLGSLAMAHGPHRVNYSTISGREPPAWAATSVRIGWTLGRPLGELGLPDRGDVNANPACHLASPRQVVECLWYSYLANALLWASVLFIVWTGAEAIWRRWRAR